MRNRIILIVVLTFCIQTVNAQTSARPSSLGVSFTLTDFLSANRIRNNSFEQVIRTKSFADINEMSPGLAITYFRGVQKHIDLALSLNAAYLTYSYRDRPASRTNNLLLEADASANLKMFPDNYFFSPYIIAGIGGSKYKNNYGAILPLGGGFKFNFFNEASLFITAQYRVGITRETTNDHFQFGLGLSGSLSGSKGD